MMGPFVLKRINPGIMIATRWRLLLCASKVNALCHKECAAVSMDILFSSGVDDSLQIHGNLTEHSRSTIDAQMGSFFQS